MTSPQPFYIPRRQRRAMVLLTLMVLLLIGISYYLYHRSSGTLAEYTRSQTEITDFIEGASVPPKPITLPKTQKKESPHKEKVTQGLIPQHVEIGE